MKSTLPHLADPDSTDSPQVPVAESGRRDRKKLATRNAIRAAALRLVTERGFANITIEAIAAAADVAPRTFFNYFPSKESAIVGHDPLKIEGLKLSLLARPAEESPIQSLRIVLLEYASSIEEEIEDFGADSSTWLRRHCIVRRDPDLLDAYAAHAIQFEGKIVEAISERLGTDPSIDPYPALLAATMLAATRVATLHWSANGGIESLPDLTDIAIGALASGLGDAAAFRSSITPDGNAVKRRQRAEIANRPTERR